MPKSIGGLLVHADEVVHAGTGNAHVPNVAPALANVTTCAAKLRTTQAAMKTTKGLRAPRNDAFVALKNAIHAVEHATLTLTGLIAGTTVMVKSRTNHGDVVGTWTDPISLVAH